MSHCVLPALFPDILWGQFTSEKDTEKDVERGSDDIWKEWFWERGLFAYLLKIRLEDWHHSHICLIHIMVKSVAN